jgi:hypothetical protein
MGICQGGLVARPFFALAHFLAFHYSLKVFLSCLFPSLANQTHILSPAHVISLIIHHFAS